MILLKDYLLLIVADLLLAANFAVSRFYQKKAGTSLGSGFGYSAVSGFFTALIFWCIGGFVFSYTPFSLLAAVILSLLGITYVLLGFRIMKRQGMALYTLFLMTGGMTVPYIFGLIFLGEPFSVLRTVGIVVIIGGVFFSCVGSKRLDAVTLILCVAVFVLNGFVSVVSKLHSIETGYATVSPSAFVVLSGAVNCVIALVLQGITVIRSAILRKKEKSSSKSDANDANEANEANDTNEKTGKRSVWQTIAVWGIVPATSALIGGLSSILQLTGAATLEASVLYPFITGGSIVFSALTGWLVFREPVTKNGVISVVLAFAGTLMFL